MKTAAEQIKNLEYVYVKSYSGLRGYNYESLVKKNNEQIDQIKQDIKTARYMQRPKLKKQIEFLNEEINIYSSRIINNDGDLHKSTVPIGEWNKDDEFVRGIIEILAQPLNDQVAAMCAPVFRDSIVFYSRENKVQGILHICFGCLWMKNEKEEDLAVDADAFDNMKKHLIHAGHQIKEQY